MRKLYLLSLLLGLSAAPALADTTPQAPTAYAHTDYQGTAFTANWDGEEGRHYLLTVYTTSDGVTRVSEDFAHVGVNGGRIDTSAPNYPAGWQVGVTDNGTTDLAYYNGQNHLVLDATGDAVTTPRFIGGRLKDLKVCASLIVPEGDITKETSSVFSIEILDLDGEVATQGQIEAMYFASRHDLDLTEAFSALPSVIGGMRLSLVKDNGKVGQVAIDSIVYSYESPDYALRDQAADGDHYDVTGLDAEKRYFYYVTETAGGLTSEPSNIVEVDPFLTPVAGEATDVTEDAFTAHWQHLPKATAYTLRAYRYETSAEDGERKVLADDFAKATEGTTDSPVSVTDLDAVTAAPGWTGRNVIMADGMVGAAAGRYPMNLSYVQSPKLNLSANDGKYTIHLRAFGTAGDYLSVYHVGYMIDTNGDGQPDALNIHKTTPFGEDGYTEETWEMTDGDDATVLSFEENKLKRYLIDEITVTQTTKAGEVTRITLDPVAIDDAGATSYRLTGLVAGGDYGYGVNGRRTDDYGNESLSELSDIVRVQLLTPTAIHDASAAGPRVALSGRTLTVTLAGAATISLRTLGGAFIETVQGHAGDNTLTLTPGSVTLVTVGGRTYKAVAR